MRYRIVKEGGGWLIENANDPELMWSGKCRSSADWSDQSVTLASWDEAAAYAHSI